MLNPIETKITDLKFTIKRLEAECKEQGFEAAGQYLSQARNVVEQAIEYADHIHQQRKDD